MKNNSLDNIRNRINEIDGKMAELFELRMRAASEVAEYKKANGLPVRDFSREDEVVRRGVERINDGEISEYYVNFLKNTIALSCAYQDRILSGMNVAYSGTEGAFAHIATRKLFPTAKKTAFPDFVSAYSAVENGDCDVAVLPIENSYHGEVDQVTDLMFSGSLYINAVTELAVTQDLLAVAGAKREDVKEVVSHPQALAQCAGYISTHGYTVREYANTALAAKYVAENGDKSIAAIASAEAAEIFGLQVLDNNINESRNNTTRFATFSRAQNRFAPSVKGVHTILMFTVRNEAGALAKALSVIGKHGFNMRALRSRPMKELLWQYFFYVEAEGNVNTENGAGMMTELERYCDKLKAVGAFIKD